MEEIIKQFNLPTYIKGKSFADASKLIQKRFEGREDAESVATKTELMGRLRQAQDHVKQLQEFANGSEAPEGAVETPAVTHTDQNQNFLGGILSKLSGDGSPQVPGTTQEPGTNVGSGAASIAGMAAGPLGALAAPVAGKVLDTGIDAVAGLFNKDKNAEEEALRTQTLANSNQFNNSFAEGGKITDPITDPKKLKPGQIAEVKANVQNETGIEFHSGSINSLFGNDDTAGGSNAQPDLDLGIYKDRGFFNVQKRGTDYNIVPTGSNPQNAQGFNKQLQELIKGNPNAKITGAYSQFQNRNAHGGKMNSYVDGGRMTGLNPELVNFLKGIKGNEATISESQLQTSPGRGLTETSVGSITPGESTDGFQPFNNDQGVGVSHPKFGAFAPTDTGETSPNDPNVLASSLLRSAPSIANLGQLLALKKPGEEGLGRINTRFEENLTDETALTNLVKGQTAGNREAILNASGGSGATARANLLANNLQGTKALSDAYLASTDKNIAQKTAGQQFNLDVAKTNLGQSNIENDINAKNLGNFQTQKSKLLGQMGTDIGLMGREELFKKYPELMGADYNWLGKFIKDNPKATA